MPTIVKKLEFDYGHRVLGHEGKCKNLHGHRGVIEVTVHAPHLDLLGRVIDFGVIKKLFGGYLDERIDHKLILNKDDPQAEHLMLSEPEGSIVIMQGNPTAENLAEYLYFIAASLLEWDNHTPTGLKVIAVKFYETPNSWAMFPDIASVQVPKS